MTRGLMESEILEQFIKKHVETVSEYHLIKNILNELEINAKKDFLKDLLTETEQKITVFLDTWTQYATKEDAAEYIGRLLELQELKIRLQSRLENDL